MISLIICEKDAYMRSLYTKIIKRFFYLSNDYYMIYEFDKYNRETYSTINKIEGERIYLIDNLVPGKNGIEIARMIRKNGDYTSPIILFSKDITISNPKNIKNTLILNIICKNDDLVKELWESLKDSYKILTRHSALTFSFYDEVYRLPYDDIYYIKKNAHDDSVTIFTKDDSYIDYISIKGMEKRLNSDPRFFRSHRSCIVNLYNISSYDKKDNLVIFNNGLQTNLICRSNKKTLEERLSICEYDKY